MRLVAKKPFPYAKRRLKAGDYFTARTPTEGRALIAIGRARRAEGGAPVKQDPPKAGIDALRAEYVKVVGKRPYHGWDESELAAKISEARAAD